MIYSSGTGGLLPAAGISLLFSNDRSTDGATMSDVAVFSFHQSSKGA